MTLIGVRASESNEKRPQARFFPNVLSSWSNTLPLYHESNIYIQSKHSHEALVCFGISRTVLSSAASKGKRTVSCSKYKGMMMGGADKFLCRSQMA